MLAVFENAIASPPQELNLPSKGSPTSTTRRELANIFRANAPDSTFFSLPNDNFIALDESVKSPRSVTVMDNVFCVFMGTMENICDMRRHYGLCRQASEAMVVVEAYKVLRDRAPYPPDQVVKDLDGKFAFLLFDSACGTFFTARDRDGFVNLDWGVTGDGSLVCSDDGGVVREACGRSRSTFPAGCMFINGRGLISFDHPLRKVKAVPVEDDAGGIRGLYFKIDLYSRLHSIPRTGSESNWAGAAVVEGEYRV